MQQLLESGLIERALVWQACFGGPVHKPTYFAACHVPDFRKIINTHRQNVDWQQLLTMQGRGAGGWKTSARKEYPPARSQARAHSQVSASRSPFDGQDVVVVLPEGFQDVFAQLYKGDADPMVKCMQPDSAQHIVRNNLFQLDWHAEAPLCWHVFVSLFETGSNVSLYSLFYALALILWLSQRGSICYFVLHALVPQFRICFHVCFMIFHVACGHSPLKAAKSKKNKHNMQSPQKYLSILCSMYFYLEGLHTRRLCIIINPPHLDSIVRVSVPDSLLLHSRCLVLKLP